MCLVPSRSVRAFGRHPDSTRERLGKIDRGGHRLKLSEIDRQCERPIRPFALRAGPIRARSDGQGVIARGVVLSASLDEFTPSA
jgi:hypothetical protein